MCRVVVCGLWCPSIWGGVSVGSQDGGCRRMIPDSGGWCSLVVLGNAVDW